MVLRIGSDEASQVFEQLPRLLAQGVLPRALRQVGVGISRVCPVPMVAGGGCVGSIGVAASEVRSSCLGGLGHPQGRRGALERSAHRHPSGSRGRGAEGRWRLVALDGRRTGCPPQRLAVPAQVRGAGRYVPVYELFRVSEVEGGLPPHAAGG